MFPTFTRLGIGSNLPQRQLAYAIYIYKQKAEKGVSEEVDINELYSFWNIDNIDVNDFEMDIHTKSESATDYWEIPHNTELKVHYILSQRAAA